MGDDTTFADALLGVHAVVTSYDQSNFRGARIPVPTNLNLQYGKNFVLHLKITTLSNIYSLGFLQDTRAPPPHPHFTIIPQMSIIVLMWQCIFSKSSGREPCCALLTNPLSLPGLKLTPFSLGPRRTLICDVSSWIYPGLSPWGSV